MNLNQNCPCPNIKCERHGNCIACRKFHADLIHPLYGGVTACQRKK